MFTLLVSAGRHIMERHTNQTNIKATVRLAGKMILKKSPKNGSQRKTKKKNHGGQYMDQNMVVTMVVTYESLGWGTLYGTHEKGFAEEGEEDPFHDPEEN